MTRRHTYYRLAHDYVTAAVYHGDLPKLDGSVECVDCGEPAREYDHRDYKRPMDVEPVCRRCNQARGPGKHAGPSGRRKTLRERFEEKSAA